MGIGTDRNLGGGIGHLSTTSPCSSLRRTNLPMSSSTPITTAQLQCIKQGGPMEIVQVPYPSSLSPGEVLVWQKVIALNLIDTKQRDFSIMIEKWPHVLGFEGAGVIEAVGDDVRDLKV